MADFPTRQDFFRIARDEVLRLRGEITREVMERPGSDANIMANLGVVLADEVIGQLIDVCSGAYLTSSRGAKLDRYVFDRYNMKRKRASPALGSVEFSTTVANPATFTIPVSTKLSTPEGNEFVTTVATSFPAGSIGPIFVPVRSVLAGADQQANVGAISAIASTIAGAPGDLVVTNNVATAGADDREEDEALIDRARRFWTTVQRGTVGAIEAGALATPGVNKASVIETLDGLGRPVAFVQCIIADRFTDALANLTVDDPAFAAQSQQLAQQVFFNLSNIRAAGIFVHVIVGQVVLQSVQLQLTFAAGVSADEVALQARAAVTNFINRLAPGASFDPDAAIEGALRNVGGLIITGDEIVTPAGVVVPKATQVIRSALGLVTAAAVQSSQPVALTTNPDAFIASEPLEF